MLKKKITARKFYRTDGKMFAKELNFEVDVDKLAKLQSEEAVKRAIKEYARGMKVLTKEEIDEAKFDWKECLETWREKRKTKGNSMENIPPSRITSSAITTLASNEVFVFGSNLEGQHYGGAARYAYEHFGAVWGKGVGLYGMSYAIPTMQGGAETIKPYVDDFISFARQHPSKRFLVTPIGCGIAGLDPRQIAPLFREAVQESNISLPFNFWHILLESES